MPSPFDAAGAEHIASGFAPLTMDRYITGLVTNRSPIRDAAVSYQQAKYYGASRFDSIIDGLNMELTARLTLARRPGQSVYNSQTFPAIQRYYKFGVLIDNRPSIRVIVDTAAAVYDATGPNTKRLLWTKATGAGKTSFQSVGNTLYAADGKTNRKWTVSTKSYQPATLYGAGDFINDPNNNLQVAYGMVAAQVVSSAVAASSAGNDQLTLTFNGTTPYGIDEAVLLQSLTVAALANGLTLTVTAVGTDTATFTLPVPAASSWGTTTDSGTASGGGTASGASGTTGSSAPTWATTAGALTVDGGVVWVCKGPDLQLWGTAWPTDAPTLTQQSVSSGYGSWLANTYFSPHLLTYSAANPSVFAVATQAGTTGSTEPTFASSVGGTVTDGSVVWTTVNAAWAASAAVSVGALIVGKTAAVVPTPGPFNSGWAFAFGLQSTGPGDGTNAGTVVTEYYSDATTAPPDNDLITAFSSGNPVYLYLQMQAAAAGLTNPITVKVTGVGQGIPPGQTRSFYYFTYTVATSQNLYSTGQAGYRIQYQRLISNLVAYRCIQAGNTGATAPSWASGYGTQIADGDAIWQAIGAVPEWGMFSNATISLAQTIIDADGFLQNITVAGLTGTAQPTWNDTLAGLTLNDGTATWTCGGGYAAASVGQIGYAFAFKNSVAKTESNASPIVWVNRQTMHQVMIQGPGSADTQVDTIVVYRTVDEGSSLLYDTEFASPLTGANGRWVFLDISADKDLNVLIQGAISDANDPPPAGLTALSYHMSRIWGSVGPLQYFCTGPDVMAGNGLEAWSPGKVFALPGNVSRSVPWDLPDGVLLSFTDAGPFAIWGQGTASDPFYDKPFTQGAGLLSYDEMEVAEGWIYQLTTDRRLLSFQPTAGYGVNGSVTDAGAPIGDQFKKVTTGGISAALYTPGNSYVTWHADGSNDVGLFVADGATGWFRYSQVTQPETGYFWSPLAQLAGGTSAVASVETTPGHKTLLIGPANSGPILMRDASTNADNGTAFSGYTTIGSIALCSPTEIAEVVAIILDSMRVGTSPGVAILLGEIAATIKRPFLALQKTGNDPANLVQSETLNNDYFSLEQTGFTNQCRHMQIKISLTTENFPNEILGHAVYGRIIPQRRQE